MQLDLIFEWDEQKAWCNKLKHGISFETAVHVFADCNRIEYFDEKHSYSEARYITIGLVREIVVVVYICRDPSIRIISARKANEKEIRRYQDGY